MSDTNKDELIALVAGSLAVSKLTIDQVIVGKTGKKVRVRVGDKEYMGKVSGFDGERLVLIHDLGLGTVIWLKSGVAMSEIEGEDL